MTRRGRADPGAVAAVGLSIAAVALHAIAFAHQGALWRDEANAVEMGRMTLPEAWANLPFDSILIGPIAVLRAMAVAGLSGDDTALRALGMAFGIAILALLWFAGLRLFGRPPVIALLLFGLSPVGVRYGDSLRAYGLATSAMLVAYVSCALAARDPARGRIALAALAAAVAVQCSYLNAVLVAGLCAGAAVVAIRARSQRRLAMALVPGFAGAASALVYLGRMRATWTVLDVQVRPLSLGETMKRFGAAISTPSRLIFAVWLAAALAAAAAVAWRWRSGAGTGDADPGSPAFAGAALAVGAPLYLLFLKTAGVEPNPWHFTPLLAFLALGLDGVIGAAAADSARLRGVLALLAAAAAVAVLPGALRFVRERHTNVDRVAAILNERAARGDLVVVSPYHVGVSFQRYYRGAAEWTTLPPVTDHRVHRFDQLHAAMASADPLAPVLAQAEEALRSGHRVFAVAADPLFAEPPSRPDTPAVPDPRWGWNAGRHFSAWSRQLGYFLQTRAARREPIAVPEDEQVSWYERMQLVEADGYLTSGVDPR
jgi:hypothetical protein